MSTHSSFLLSQDREVYEYEGKLMLATKMSKLEELFNGTSTRDNIGRGLWAAVSIYEQLANKGNDMEGLKPL